MALEQNTPTEAPKKEGETANTWKSIGSLAAKLVREAGK